jgi:hypothetical protein
MSFEKTLALLSVAGIIVTIGGIVFLVRGFTDKSQLRKTLSILGIAWLGFHLLGIVISLALAVSLMRYPPQ